jgi:imidazolonepropionase-like amidohydrolase
VPILKWAAAFSKSATDVSFAYRNHQKASGSAAVVQTAHTERYLPQPHDIRLFWSRDVSQAQRPTHNSEVARLMRSILITAPRLFDGAAAFAVDAAALLIEDDRIAALGRRAEIPLPSGRDVKIYDYPEATILPGLVDAHMHLAAPGDGTPGEGVGLEDEAVLLLRSAANARAILESGVTTLRENGNKGRVAFVLRESITRGIVEGPRLIVAGRPICTTGGHLWFFGGEADGLEGVRVTVRQLLKEGADWIKIIATGGSTLVSGRRRPSFTVEELAAICDEARRRGSLTGAHATATSGIENAINAGVNMLIHCNFFGPDGSYQYRPDLVDRATAAGIWINPTLFAWQTDLDGLLDKRERVGLTSTEAAALAALPDQIEKIVEACGRMLQDGANITAGSDTPWRYAIPTGGLAGEAEMLTRAGMTNIEALVAATSAAAESIGVADRAGRLAVGRQADVTIVSGDPMTSIGALRQVEDVFLAGRRVAKTIESHTET